MLEERSFISFSFGIFDSSYVHETSASFFVSRETNFNNMQIDHFQIRNDVNNKSPDAEYFPN